uniref:TOX high mobility group box family member 4 n=1 Tax=Papio anubis TaxID=9555 RepID=A0A8I5NLN6_PAPAN
MITGPSHPFLSGAEIFHTPSLGDEEFEIPPISLDSDPSLAVSDVVDHFDDLADPSSSQNGSFSAQYGVQTLNIPVGMTHEPPALFPTTVNSTLSSYVANQASSGVGSQPNITKLIITKQTLPSSITMSQGGMVTVIPATVVTSQGLQLGQTSTATIQPSQQAQIVTWSVSQATAAAAASMQLPPPRLQPPPLQQMPQPPTQQQVTISQQPPPLQAIKQPPPQKIKSVSLPTLKVQTTLVPPTVESSPEQPMNNSPEAHTVEATSPETICEMITDIDVELVSGSPVALSPQLRCLSSGCENTSTVSKDWNNEYCSNECVVKHCRDVFLIWVASRNSNTVVFVK